MIGTRAALLITHFTADGKLVRFDAVDMSANQVDALIFKHAKNLMSKEAE